jgi:hypothetical protein
MFDAEVRRTGARTVLMQTWSRRDQPEDQAALDHAYDSVARELEALLAPVGRAWQRARQEQPTIELYASDGSHPAAAGSYLLACTLLFTLLPEARAELPPSVSGPAVSTAGVVDAGSDTVLVTLPPEHARRLQAIASAVVGDLKRQGGYLHASPPARPAPAPPGGPPLNAERLAGAWSGDLTYFPSPARFDLTLRVEGGKCEGEVAIQVPQRRQRYEAPLGTCQIAADTIRFTVGTLPLPFLFDRFEGRLVDERLVGTVERTGRELTNAMSGVWTLGRGGEAAPSGAR